ncbi:MAG: WD40 repeat domain-containing protein [Treponema sp.]|jgi:hypothetical protein|nr:WD40 repeat domain-containing protein [Treponema sp.]
MKPLPSEKKPLRGRNPAFSLLLLIVPVFFSPAAGLEAQTPETQEEQRPAGAHRGRINALVHDGNSRIISAGEDGFIGVWDIGEGSAEARFQISEHPLLSLAARPGRSEVAAIESDRMGLYRVSVWDYVEKRNLFSLRFGDPLLFVNYSASGSFIIVSRSARSVLAFIQSETGEILQSPEDLAVTVSLAATGISERTMVTYSPAGTLSYWALGTGSEIRRFSVPANLSSPVLFGNNSFLAALEENKLVILDAVSGNEIFRESGINHLALFPSENEGREFLGLSANGAATELLLYRITNAARLEIAVRKIIPGNMAVNAAIGGISFYTAILGASDGRLYFLPINGNPIPASVSALTAVQEGAVSNGILAFIAAGGLSGFIPCDFSEFSAGFPIKLAGETPFTRVTSEPAVSRQAGDAGRFLYWEDSGSRGIPVLKTVSADYSGGRAYPEYREQSQTPLRHLSIRPPASSVSILGSLALFMDPAGSVQVISLDSQTAEFSYTSAGSLDAAFLDEQNIILARSAADGNSPFLKINIVTGETVPLQYPASAGVKVSRASDGGLYGTVITGSGMDSRTVVLLLDTSNSPRSPGVIEYPGENLDFSLAEEKGIIASDLGGDGAILYNGQESARFERAEGLPRRILSGGAFFVIIDSEGNIAWHDGKTGRLAALLRIYPDAWVLERKDSPPLRGPVLVK